MGIRKFKNMPINDLKKCAKDLYNKVFIAESFRNKDLGYLATICELLNKRGYKLNNREHLGLIIKRG